MRDLSKTNANLNTSSDKSLKRDIMLDLDDVLDDEEIEMVENAVMEARRNKYPKIRGKFIVTSIEHNCK